MAGWAHARWPLAVACGTMIAAAGCGREPRLVPVSGRVLLDGRPLTQGGVLFQPERGMAARGAIGPDGRFVLGYRHTADGAPVGRHGVAVVCFEAAAPADPAVAAANELGVGRSLIPERYASPLTSGLVVDVRPGMEPVTIELGVE